MSGKIVRFNRSLYGLKHAPQSSVGWRPDCNPTDRHWKAVLKIMSYLHGSRGIGLNFVTVAAMAIQTNTHPPAKTLRDWLNKQEKANVLSRRAHRPQPAFESRSTNATAGGAATLLYCFLQTRYYQVLQNTFIHVATVQETTLVFYNHSEGKAVYLYINTYDVFEFGLNWPIPDMQGLNTCYDLR